MNDGSAPAAAKFSGYAMFMNIGKTINNARPFELKEFVSGGPPS